MDNKTKFNRWINLGSRSGKTLDEVCKALGKRPDTNYNSKNFSKEVIESQLRRLYSKEKTLITLMGYLRIVPEDICREFTVMNIHPAPIHLKPYERYKGKDPIERYWKERPNSSNVVHLWGSVLHVATPELDEGPIIANRIFGCRDLEECYNNSFSANIDLWVKYLKEVI